MSKFEILCVTMNQNDFSKIKDMNIHSDVIFANQCNYTSYREFKFENYLAKMISTETKGVGINRNLTLTYASAEICLLADDDVFYDNNMAEKVIAEFDAYPDADVIIFHLETDDLVRNQAKYNKTRKWSKFKGLPWGGVRIAFRSNSVRKANVWFTPLFGGGAIFPSGEDSMFLMDLRKKKLKIYVSKETIGIVSFNTSSWYTGENEKYFYAKGAFYGAAHPKSVYIWMIYFSFKTKNSNLPILQKLIWMIYGLDGYKKMLSFNDYTYFKNNNYRR